MTWHVKTKVTSVAVSLVAIGLLVYVGVAGLLFVLQRDFLYHPTPNYEHPFDHIDIVSQGETINVIVLNKGNNKALVYFGGNGEAVVANGAEFKSVFPETTTYLVNYRGYGGSSGEPIESGLFADALTIYDEIQAHHSSVSVVGRSLGSGVATHLAASRPVDALALITPFDSVLSLAKAKFPLFPVKFLLKDHFDSLSRAKAIKSKVLVIAAEDDAVIPMSHTQRLVDGFNDAQVDLRIIENAGHNNLSSSPDYYRILSGFI